MKICLKTKEKERAIQRTVLYISERLPIHFNNPCQLACEYQVIARDNYYVLKLHVEGELDLTCQRCSQPFLHQYHNETELAVCDRDEVAEKVLESFESIVARGFLIDISEVVTDELHLSAPEKHVSEDECDSEIVSILGSLGETQ